MSEMAETVEDWLEQAGIAQQRLTPAQQAVLNAVFCFRLRQGSDYYSTRLLAHFLLHADTGLKVAAVARLLGISRPTASEQQGIPSKDVFRSVAHRLAGRPYGKLLPRHAGPVAAFLLGHPDATRADVLQFLKDSFSVCVSRVALHKFLKKYGLADVAAPADVPVFAAATLDTAAEPVQTPSDSEPLPATGQAPPAEPPVVAAPAVLIVPVPLAAPTAVIELAKLTGSGLPSAPPFCSDERSTPVPSC